MILFVFSKKVKALKSEFKSKSEIIVACIKHSHKTLHISSYSTPLCTRVIRFKPVWVHADTIQFVPESISVGEY